MPKLEKTVRGRKLFLLSMIPPVSGRNNDSPPDIRVLFSKDGNPWTKSGPSKKNETKQKAELRYFKELRTFILGKNGLQGLAVKANWPHREDIEQFFDEFQEMLKSQPIEA